MLVLMLTPELPQRDGTGGGKRLFELVLALRERGHRVAVGSVARRDQASAVEALRAAGIDVITAVRPEPQWREGLTALVRAPRTAGVLARHSFLRFQAAAFAAELAPALDAWLAANRPDVALVEHDWALDELARLLPSGVPLLAGIHNDTALLRRRSAETASGPARWFLAREARREAAAAGRLPAAFRGGYACSAEEARTFEQRTALPFTVAPNGADVDALGAIPIGAGEPGHLLFSGSLGYPPNAEGAIWLATEVLPRVRRELPEARLTIVGRGAPAALQRLASEHVTLAGFVPDLDPVLASASVYAAGLRNGAGTKLKVVEALAAGRALVATPVAAEGIDIRDGVHALIADDADAFAAATLRLLRDQALANRLAAAGRALAIERYSWAHAADVLDAQLRALVPGD